MPDRQIEVVNESYTRFWKSIELSSGTGTCGQIEIKGGKISVSIHLSYTCFSTGRTILD